MILGHDAPPRLQFLSKLWAYLKGQQYDHLSRSFDDAVDDGGVPVPFRSRRPALIVPILRRCTSVYVSALWSKAQRPVASLAGQQGTDDNDALDALINEAGVYRAMREATTHALAMGTGCVAWAVRDERFRAHAFDPKHCNPTFAAGRFPLLAELEVCFQTQREVIDPITKQRVARDFWHREVITAERWVCYQPAPVIEGRAPAWVEDTAQTVEHGLGFVPAVWFTVGEPGPFEPDGTSMYEDLLSLVDDLNYTASQAGRALGLNLDPQVVITGMNEEDLGALQKNGKNVWGFPAGSDAKLLESNGEFIRSSSERLNYLRKQIFDACSVVVNDPEKVGGPQSGSALRQLAAPMLGKLDDLREDIGSGALVPLLEQMLRVKQPGNTAAVILSWGPLMPTGPDEAKVAVEAAAAAVVAGITSKAAARRWIAPYFGVTDIEADQSELDKEQLADQSRVLETAVATSTLHMPSATFQRAHKSRVARTLLGNDATPQQLSAIDRELNHNISHEEQLGSLNLSKGRTDERFSDDGSDPDGADAGAADDRGE